MILASTRQLGTYHKFVKATLNAKYGVPRVLLFFYALYAFAARKCNKYRNIMCWHVLTFLHLEFMVMKNIILSMNFPEIKTVSSLVNLKSIVIRDLI